MHRARLPNAARGSAGRRAAAALRRSSASPPGTRLSLRQMDDFNLNELFEMLNPEPEEGPDPDYRATYRAKRLTVIRWFPGMTDMGPAVELLSPAREGRHRDR